MPRGLQTAASQSQEFSLGEAFTLFHLLRKLPVIRARLGSATTLIWTTADKQHRILLYLQLKVTTWVQLVLSARELSTTAMHSLQISHVYTIPPQIQQAKPANIPCCCDCGGPGLKNTCHQKRCNQESTHFHTSNKIEGEVFMMGPRSLILYSFRSFSFFFQLLINIK
ncbi:hypothetical protein Baya_10474 [Bagarius yarrelli]|uniref:Uncharacterized protein n=1 Tax=Bagarius yarrelli TaxID=175774 RepID=A0A556UYD4_BAGYA|nr:hypothetical protein Baya_10474 [Bagarius yarrelli]